MKIAVFSTKPYDRRYLEKANASLGHHLTFFEARLNETTVPLARKFPCVCVFVNDQVDAAVVEQLRQGGTRLLALRSAGYNHVDLQKAQEVGLTVARVPAYSPHAVAEHTVALLMALNRNTHRAYNRVRDGNFSLEGLLGFDLYGLTVGIIGTGKIGEATSRIFQGFGCRLLGFDVAVNPRCQEIGLKYVSLEELLGRSDVVSLHCPLTPQTYHLINLKTIAQMKPGVTLLNTSRGALIDAQAVIEGLKTGHIRYLGLDVYEEEGDLFFEDLSNQIIQDDVFARLLTFPNVVITGHQGFFTREALSNIAQTTLENVSEFERNGRCQNAVTLAGTKGA
jgi:D-lactate dehydrogenase